MTLHNVMQLQKWWFRVLSKFKHFVFIPVLCKNEWKCHEWFGAQWMQQMALQSPTCVILASQRHDISTPRDLCEHLKWSYTHYVRLNSLWKGDDDSISQMCGSLLQMKTFMFNPRKRSNRFELWYPNQYLKRAFQWFIYVLSKHHLISWARNVANILRMKGLFKHWAFCKLLFSCLKPFDL